MRRHFVCCCAKNRRIRLCRRIFPSRRNRNSPDSLPQREIPQIDHAACKRQRRTEILYHVLQIFIVLRAVCDDDDVLPLALGDGRERRAVNRFLPLRRLRGRRKRQTMRRFSATKYNDIKTGGEFLKSAAAGLFSNGLYTKIRCRHSHSLTSSFPQLLCALFWANFR